MSINLHVNDYCQQCSNFDADVEKKEHVDVFGNYLSTDTNIHCKHRHICKRLLQHLKTEAAYEERTKTIVDLYNETEE